MATVGTNAALEGGDNTNGGTPAHRQPGPGQTLPQSLRMNGSDDAIDISGAAVSFADSTAFSVSFWARFENTTSQCIGDSANASNNRLNRISATQFQYRNSAGTGVTFTVQAHDLGVWHHVLFTRTAGNSGRLWLDGIESSSGAQTCSGTFAPNRIGRTGSTFSAATTFADVRIYDSDETSNAAAIMVAGPWIAQANGDWDNSATWLRSGGGTPSEANDDYVFVPLGKSVAVDAAASCGDGSSNIVLTVTGVLNVVGAPLTVRGSSQFLPSTNAAASANTCLTITNSGATPAGIIFDCDSATTPTVNTGGGCRWIFTGTDVAPWYFRTKSSVDISDDAAAWADIDPAGYTPDGGNSAGNNVRVIPTTNVDLTLEATNGVFHKVGTSSVSAFAHIRAINSTHDTLLNDILWDNCGTPSIAYNSTATTTDFVMERNVFDNILATAPFLLSMDNTPSGSPLRNLRYNIIPGNFTFTRQTGLVVDANVFTGQFHAVRSSGQWASCQHNYFYYNTNSLYEMGGSVNNNLILRTDALQDGLSAFLSHYSSCDFNANVIDYHGTLDGNRNCFSPGEVGLGADSTHNVKNNIMLPTSNGKGGGNLVQSTSLDGGGFKKYVNVEHNTAWIGTAGALISVRETNTGQFVGQVASCKSNVLVGRSGGSTRYAIKNTEGTDGQELTDAAPAANITHNCWNSLDLTPAGAWNSTTGDDNTADGTPYNSPMSGATPPGANDLTSTDSQPVDATRNIATYDTAASGLNNAVATAWVTSTSYAAGAIRSNTGSAFYGGTPINFRCIVAHTSGSTTEPGVGSSWRTNWEVATIYRFRFDPTIVEDCIDWIRDGIRPTNIGLQNSGHDGVTRGAVEGVFTAGGGAVYYYPQSKAERDDRDRKQFYAALGAATNWGLSQ